MPSRVKCACLSASRLVIACLVFLAAFGCSKPSGSAAPATANSSAEETDPTFIVPNGTPDVIFDFVRKLNERRPTVSNERQGIEFAIRVQKASVCAADKILAQDLDDTNLREAVKLKMIAMLRLASIQIETTDNENDQAVNALKTVDEFRQDRRPIVAEVASDFRLVAQAMNLRQMNESDRTKLVEETLQAVADKQSSQDSVTDAEFLADRFAKIGQVETGASLYDRLAETMEQTGNRQAKSFASQMRSKGNRLRLPGSQLEIEGKLIDGSDLDWASYRGKVVLVDFWATWCGPCLGELPNVKANYIKYHSRGFEVVGISLDQDRKKLEGFLKSDPLPWVQLFDGDNAKSRGWQHPMAQKFGVSSIPTAFLVDQEGKVVSVQARGEELERLLSKLLGSEG